MKKMAMAGWLDYVKVMLISVQLLSILVEAEAYPKVGKTEG